LEAVIDALWPSLDANAPRASFEMAVSRLRRLLDQPDAVRVSDGQVSLDARLVWVDVTAFEQLAGQGEAERDRALALYRGPLLGDEKLDALLGQARTRLTLVHAMLVQTRAEQLLASGQGAAAIRLLQRALVQDPLDEALHRALIQAWLQQGEQAEALRAYHRCREVLAEQLGVAPAAKTRALVERP
jgi:DNA-binding SARP family transcriptional activator